jgi:uncharacterized membrane protein HdeD (DUF308 family)
MSGAELDDEVREVAHGVGHLWWLWLVLGVFWLTAAYVILQFDQASVKTVGILIGIMFLVASAQQFVLFAVADHMRWLFAMFGVLFLAAGVVCFIDPKNTFAGIADILGVLFFLVGLWWTVQAFLERETNSLWWLGLIGGILMLILAFWTSGQFFIHKAYTLLVFAGIWALMSGVINIVRAFQVRRLKEV